MDANGSGSDSNLAVGFLTRTLSDSPVAKFVLSLSYDRGWLCVGEDYVHHYIYDDETGAVAFKGSLPRFEHRILAAAILPNIEWRLGKQDDRLAAQWRHLVADLLLLTLEDGTLVLYRYSPFENGQLFSIQADKKWLPRSADPLRSVGKLIAVAETSAAFAIAAPDSEGGLILYDVLDGPELGHKTLERAPDILDHGHILHMAFLTTGSHRDINRLLLVKVVKKKLVLQRLEWLREDGCARAKSFPQQRIDLHDGVGSPKCVLPDLLVVLPRPGAFILAASSGLWLFTDIESGFAKQQRIELPPIDLPKSDCPHPIWVSYYRRKSGVVLFRDDGLVVRLHGFDMPPLVCTSLSGASSGFPLVPIQQGVHLISEDDFEQMIFVRDSEGQGGVFVLSLTDESAPATTMSTFQTGRTPTWATGFDLVCASPLRPSGHGSKQERIFVTSGSGKMGQVTELRAGYEAITFMSFDLEKDQPPSSILTGPLRFPGGVCVDETYSDLFIMLTSPRPPGSSAQVIKFTADGPWMIDSATSELDGSDLPAIDVSDRTIAVARCPGRRKYFQITNRKVLEFGDMDDTPRVLVELEQHQGTISLGSISSGHGKEATLVSYMRTPPDSDPLFTMLLVEDNTEYLAEMSWSRTVTAMAGTCWRGGYYCILAAPGGRLNIMKLMNINSGEPAQVVDWNFFEGRNIPAEAIEILPYEHELQVLCALRNGDVWRCRLIFDGIYSEPRLTQPTNVADSPEFGFLQETSLGLTTVTLTRVSTAHTNDPKRPEHAFLAACEDRLFLITAANETGELTVVPVWLTDRDDQSLTHENISGATLVQESLYYEGQDVEGSLVVVMGSKVMVAQLQQTTRNSIPRSLISPRDPPLNSSNRLLYSQSLYHFVVAGTEQGVLTESGKARHYSRGIIEYRPVWSKSNGEHGRKPARVLLQAGERVSALEEWAYSGNSGKKYVFTLVGTALNTAGSTSGSAPSSSGTMVGRIHILRPSKNQRRHVDGVEIIHTIKLDEPVYCMVMKDEMTLLVGHGSIISCYIYSQSDKKWLSTSAYLLTSPAVAMTMTDGCLHVTTIRDSLMMFHVSDDGSLVCAYTDSQAAAGLHHITLPVVHDAAVTYLSDKDVEIVDDDSGEGCCIDLLTTKTAQLRGLFVHKRPRTSASSQKTSCAFVANLPRSITRMRTLEKGAIGITTDGTLYGLLLLSPFNWARLKALELLIRRSDLGEFCGTCGPVHPVGSLPVGLAGLNRYPNETDLGFEARTGFPADVEPDEVIRLAPVCGRFELPHLLRPWALKPEDMYINGDVLARLVLPWEKRTSLSPVEALKEMIWAEVCRRPQDRLSAHCMAYGDSELDLIPDTIDLARQVITQWGFW